MPYRNAGEVRGKGYQEPAVENPPYEPCTDMTTPEKDPGRTITKMKRLSGSHPAPSQKVRDFPSQK